ncbi:hypothetical protein D9758_009140 [Tetrapyrgos nigripes]|uniref:Uncharacterized protein n=1 Tax=Tetrapyrgos nigripes TaxID=182062 RepID=A0A8H5G8P1_9AGAR|nr:hypothetical protein D9758_009140 [Tetrapyrgos nigripes]
MLSTPKFLQVILLTIAFSIFLTSSSVAFAAAPPTSPQAAAGAIGHGAQPGTQSQSNPPAQVTKGPTGTAAVATGTKGSFPAPGTVGSHIATQTYATTATKVTANANQLKEVEQDRVELLGPSTHSGTGAPGGASGNPSTAGHASGPALGSSSGKSANKETN